MAQVLGVEVGGDTITAAVVSGDGAIVAQRSAATEPELGPDGVVDEIVALTASLSTEHGACDAVGVALTSLVQLDPASTQYAPNLRWRNAPFRAKIGGALSLPVYVTTDVRAAAAADYVFGAAKGADSIATMVVSAGVGGAIIHKGNFLQGHTDNAGEFGHMTIVAGGRECRCPNRGCLEAYAGGWAIVERVQQAARSRMDDAQALIAAAGSVAAVDVAALADVFHSGDAFATEFVDETASFIADGVTSLVNVFNPSVVTLGGDVVEALPETVTMVEERVPRRALGLSVHNLTITKSISADTAGVIGAAAVAHESLI